MAEHNCQSANAPLDAVVRLSGSKSITNRALVAAALADGVSVLSNALFSEDTEIMIDALRALGVAVAADEAAGLIEVTGCRGHIPETAATLFCGNSGTSIRFLTAMVALADGRYELDGIARMRQRPIGGLGAALQALGSAIEYPGTEGFPPVVIHARGLRGGHALFASPESSQMVSAVLLAAPYARGDVLIEIDGAVPSVPYLWMTQVLMERFGVSVLAPAPAQSLGGDRPAGSLRWIVPAQQRYQGTNYAIEPDASNATYFLAAPAVVGGRVTVEGLGTGSIQGDVRFVDVLERMGCRVNREPVRLTVEGPPADAPLHAVDVDLNDMPDTVQTLAVVAVFARGTTTIRNVASLRVKETDRLTALARELRKLGATVDEFDDGLRITGPTTTEHFSRGGEVAEPSPLGKGGSRGVDLPRAEHRPQGFSGPITIDTYDDHRMAMSFALAGLRVRGLKIADPACVAKTFPGFFAVFERMQTRT